MVRLAKAAASTSAALGRREMEGELDELGGDLDEIGGDLGESGGELDEIGELDEVGDERSGFGGASRRRARARSSGGGVKTAVLSSLFGIARPESRSRSL